MRGRSHTAFRCPASCGLTVWWSVCGRSRRASRRHMGRTGPSVRPHAPSLCENIIVHVQASFCCRADGGCAIMLGQSTASPCPSAGGGSRCGGMVVTCVIATLDAITVWRSGQWGYRFLPVCGHHCAGAVACLLTLSC